MGGFAEQGSAISSAHGPVAQLQKQTQQPEGEAESGMEYPEMFDNKENISSRYPLTVK